MPFSGREASANRDSTTELKTHININLKVNLAIFY